MNDNDIVTLAEDVVRIVKVGTPIPLDRVVWLLGGRVAFDPSTCCRAVVEIIGEHEFVLTMGMEESEAATVEGRYAIARAIGHLFLRLGYMKSETTWPRVYRDCFLHRGFAFTMEGITAERFAAALLLPEEIMFDTTTENGLLDIEAVKALCGVPTNAVRLRAKMLGFGRVY